jgi:hypothetical protein
MATRLLVFVMCVAGMTMAISAQTKELSPEALGIDIEQCANGPLAAPIPCNTQSGNDGYTRGNVNESKSHYLEGQSVPIRFIATDLVVGSTYTVTLGYDYTKSGKYATDYLTNYNRTESVNNDPCVGVPGCTLAGVTTFGIPVDPEVTNGFNQAPGGGDDIVQIPGNFSCFGCTITAFSGYVRSGSQAGDSSKTFTLTFTAQKTNIVIAYGSHISTRSDWGLANSAVNISGSPYHNFVVDFPGANGGSRDLQLSASAVIFPAFLKIIKSVTTFDLGTSSTVQFFFHATTGFSPSNDFSLVDDDGGAGVDNTQSNNFTLATGQTQVITVNERTDLFPTGQNWSLNFISCVESVSTTGSTISNGLATATITLQPEEAVVCTFNNTQLQPSAAPASISGRVVDSFGFGIANARITVLDSANGSTRYAISNPFGYYTIEDLAVGNFYFMNVSHKRYQFADDTRTFTIQDDLTGVDFIANP